MPSAVVAAEAVVVAVVVAVERKRGAAGVLAPVAVVRKQAAGRTRK